MITAKEAINIALIYMADIYPNKSGFELEEVELGDNHDHWSITVSMPDNLSSPITVLSGSNRKYKKIIIDSASGMVKGMQIRKL